MVSNGDKMEVETAELKLKEMAHSEQHYFNRYARTLPFLCASRDEDASEACDTDFDHSYNHHGMQRRGPHTSRSEDRVQSTDNT